MSTPTVCDVTTITIGDGIGPRRTISESNLVDTIRSIVAASFCDTRCLVVEIYETSTGKLIHRAFR